MNETLKFRVVVVALAIVATVVLVLSLKGLHRPPTDDGTSPKLPTDAPTGTR